MDESPEAWRTHQTSRRQEQLDVLAEVFTDALDGVVLDAAAIRIWLAEHGPFEVDAFRAAVRETLGLGIGPTGVGKSIAVRRFLLDLEESRFLVLRFTQVPSTPIGSLRSLPRLLDLPMRRHATDLFDQARERLNTYADTRGPRPMLVLDDAENTPPETLDILRRLTNWELDAGDHFAVLVVGTEDLLLTLRHPLLEPFAVAVPVRAPLAAVHSRGHPQLRALPPDRLGRAGRFADRRRDPGGVSGIAGRPPADQPAGAARDDRRRTSRRGPAGPAVPETCGGDAPVAPPGSRSPSPLGAGAPT